MLNRADIQQIEDRGSVVSDIENQINNFQKCFPFLSLKKSATTDFGIMVLSEEDITGFVDMYDAAVEDGVENIKFVPASGAASRMFKDFFSFRDEASDNSAAKNLIELPEYSKVKQFFDNLTDFAFYDDLMKYVGSSNDDKGSLDYCKIIDCLLTNKGLCYGFIPKGLIKFYINNSEPCTSVREHMVEGARYCVDSSRNVNLHFTVSDGYKILFIKEVEKKSAELEKEYGVKFNIDFSVQKPSTDTIAVDLENKPFLLDDGSLFFRPGGHGALLDNLNDISSDIIFIKNIDNVVPDNLKEPTVRYKKALAGVLLSFREKIFNYLEQLEKPIDTIPDTLLVEITGFLENDICLQHNENLNFSDKKELIRYLYVKLNRPIRVCGMVKNEGEPGGGPFIAENSDGTSSLQIVEDSQIDKSNSTQVNILKSATHFNPVDLVCGVKDFRGEKFNLLNFRDPKTGFISEKSKDGRALKAQELPGLWNGAMSDWNTFFVEVPVITFNPVKTVNDLLRFQDQ
jgi:hypothetical protein